MRKIALVLIRRLFLSVLIGCLIFAGCAVLLRAIGEYSMRRQNVKGFIARAVIACLHEETKHAQMDCRSFFKNVSDEISELQFQVWIQDSQGNLLWQNAPEAPPVIVESFGSVGDTYTVISKKKAFRSLLSVPSGYIDDPISRKRVIVGEPLAGNNMPYLRNQVLALVFVIFIFGILLSTALTFFTLSRRAKEARRVLETMRSGDLSARFRVGRLDELSELSSSFNQMVDLLAKSLQEVRASEQNRRALVGELSHDLRTPLTSMTSFIQLLRGSAHMKEGLEKECVDSISAEIKYLNQLVTSLFDLSQIESPQAKSERVPINMISILKELEGELSVSSKNRAVQFEASIPSEDVWVLGDALLAKRMYFNLIENAMRFAKARVAMTVKIERDHLHVEIADDGPGFPENLFNDFGHVPGKRNLGVNEAEVTHMGLGSVIARKITDLHEGQMTIANNASGGASVKIVLQTWHSAAIIL